MYYESEQLFKSFQDGNKKALLEILDIERPLLFDFLVRLTGNAPRAIATIDDVRTQFTSINAPWHSLSDLRVSLFQTCRNFLRDIWGSQNSFDFGSDLQRLSSIDASIIGAEDQAKRNILEAIKEISPVCLEVLLLHQRFLFSYTEIGKIIDSDKLEVEGLFKKALIEINSSTGVTGDQIAKELSRFSPAAMEDVEQITDLSDVINDLTDTRVSIKSKNYFWKFIVLLVIAASLAFWLNISNFQEILKTIKSLLH